MAGNLTKRGKDVWRIRVGFGEDPDGKRKAYSETFYGPKKNAEKRLTEILNEKNRGTFVWSTKISLNDWLDHWLDNHIKAHIAITTHGQYTRTAKLYIRPVLGKKLLSQIDQTDVQSLYNQLSLTGLSPRTIRYAHAVLRSCYRDAIRAKRVAVNPCIDIQLPKRSKQNAKSMTIEQAQAFIEASKRESRGLVYRLMLETGMRTEEVLGLQWRDVDFRTGKLKIERALVFPKEKGQSWYFADPKTESSIRSIDLSGRILVELKWHRRNQLIASRDLGLDYQRLGLVFATDFGAPLDGSNLRRRTFKKICDDAGIEGFTPHKLRHSVASLMMARGEHPKVIAERLGHADEKFTISTYSHAMPGMDREASKRHADALYGTIG